MIRKASQLFNKAICHPEAPLIFFVCTMLIFVSAVVMSTMIPTPDTEPAQQAAPRNLPESNVLLQR